MKKIILLVVAVLLILSGCSFNFSVSTANIKNAVMATDVDETGKPDDTVTEYTQDAPKFVVSAVLDNAPDNTKIRFVWNYLTEEQKITEILLDSQDKSGIYVFCNLTNDTPWPAGDYNVQIFIDEREKPDAVVSFKVK
jgi:hypothetical protein